MADKKYQELIPRTLEQRYQFAIISELCLLNKNAEKLIREVKKLSNINKPAEPKPKATTTRKKKAAPKAQEKASEVKEDEV